MTKYEVLSPIRYGAKDRKGEIVQYDLQPGDSFEFDAALAAPLLAAGALKAAPVILRPKSPELSKQPAEAKKEASAAQPTA